MVPYILLYYSLLLGVAGAVQKKKSRKRYKIVGFKPGVQVMETSNILESYGIKIKKQLPLIDACLCEVSPSAVSLQKLSEDPMIDFIEDDYVATIQGVPTGLVLGRSKGQEIPWGVKKVAAQSAWSTCRGESVRVGIIDTGIDLYHPDLKDNIKDACGILDCKNILDDNGHGTHVAGTIAALDNDIGVVGVAPKVEIYAVKAFDRYGRGNISNIVEALNWCLEKKVHVVNMSFGVKNRSFALRRAIEKLYKNNIVLVAAAGNTGKEDSVLYPAKYPEVIGVAALNMHDRPASFSSSGPEVDIIAPGVDIPSTYKNGGYKLMSGTSMATPHVTGAAALLLSLTRMSPQEVKSFLMDTARDLGLPKEKQGAGLLDVSSAVSNIKKLGRL
ncbi:S8 family peptidase [Thermosediminibacter oceani]|uniref:Peptidase S8 and S53 subtilisin kexin sedolisin n=1 Tax=Thermosediminibacter oceani (strain ATCC BAA-1034 / DSM 16646 / JW/IW-1228P) TaxID=555079 RepID=D9S1I4_THEOJ|nr:S8 family peptidase [Thermosediminibacter oceani]ADL07261.1 peptidase S8 and S53 subtilisin kexin sedolisin [Thermosediminibacter oceani DSM 16646]